MVQIQTIKATGKKYWRSLNELANTAQFNDWVHREFPATADDMQMDGASRRNVLKLMAASFGLAGLTACRRPVEHILPNVKGVEDYVPGRAWFYATGINIGGSAQGLLVEVNDGRPTKVEGNPEHPYSLGAANHYQQAAILGLYDPDRATMVLQDGNSSTWDAFGAYAKDAFSAAKLGQGDSLRFLSESVISPSLMAVRDSILSKFPKAKWVEYDAVPAMDSAAGMQLAFGQNITPRYRLDKAKVIVSLDCDFLGADSNTVLAAKEFTRGRRLAGPEGEMSRLYVVESTFSITGSVADHRLRLRSSDVKEFAADLAALLKVGGNSLKEFGKQEGSKRGELLSSIAKDLDAHRGNCLVVAGGRQPAAVQALAHLLNQALGNVGTTVAYYKSPNANPKPQLDALKELAGELSGGKVSHLVVLGGNPAFTAPADLDLTDNIKKASNTVYVGLEVDETAALSKWALPEAHFLESWGDVAATDGTATIQQPMIQPLYGGRTQAEVLAQVFGYKDQRSYDIVRNFWLAKLGANEKAWKKALHDGTVPNTTYTEVKPSVDANRVNAALQGTNPGQGIEVVFTRDHKIFDGRFANNGWLQELPDPMTKLTWDNAAWVGPATAKKLGVDQGDMLVIERNGKTLEIPVLLQPGLANDSITIPIGYGRTKVGRVGKGVGFNAYRIRTTDAFHFGSFNVRKGSGTYELVQTQEHYPINDLGNPETKRRAGILVRETSLEEFKKEPKVIQEMVEQPEMFSIYGNHDYSKGYQWGMSIDLNTCIGCNSCVIACQSENNIPIVGKKEVARGREMHWIRIDRYYKGDDEEATAVMQPLPCMQCENAPCENVCPVAATAHSPEGLNEMAYNRCVGTRYCSNNCPYKVRRFNFLAWHYGTPDVEKMKFNPDVSVRMRGVMEKCTYCVQRIQEAKIKAKVEGRREIKDGEIQTACQQTCPAEAIVFGNVNDPNSRVAKLKKQERNYGILEELNTRPRTTYLAKIRNTNPELEAHHG